MSTHWKDEFQEFLSATEIDPPALVTQSVLGKIRMDLNPPALRVFLKVSVIHLVVATITLLFCPQFGFSFSAGPGLMGLLMKYGEGVCMLGCGAVFLGASALVSSLILRAAEIRKLRQSAFLQFSLLSVVSLVVLLAAIGTGIEMIFLAWLIGSILGGMASLELGWAIRSLIRRGMIHGI
jgi:hypothetical protein